MTLPVMYLLYAGAVSALFLGMLLLFFPKQLAKLNEVANRIAIGTERYMFLYRIIIGILLLVFAVFLIYVIRSMPLKI